MHSNSPPLRHLTHRLETSSRMAVRMALKPIRASSEITTGPARGLFSSHLPTTHWQKPQQLNHLIDLDFSRSALTRAM